MSFRANQGGDALLVLHVGGVCSVSSSLQPCEKGSRRSNLIHAGGMASNGSEMQRESNA